MEMGIIGWIVVGLIAGAISGALLGGTTARGCLPNVVVGILGVETFYGRITGKFRVIDALTTLAFHYPPRADFFRDELRQFLLLTREEAVDPLTALRRD